jgi:hypothetical protein
VIATLYIESKDVNNRHRRAKVQNLLKGRRRGIQSPNTMNMGSANEMLLLLLLLVLGVSDTLAFN